MFYPLAGHAPSNQVGVTGSSANVVDARHDSAVAASLVYDSDMLFVLCYAHCGVVLIRVSLQKCFLIIIKQGRFSFKYRHE